MTTTSSLKPTPEQQAIIDSMDLSGSKMVGAYAGCSKSTTLEMAAPRIRDACLALAFNKSIADELKPRMPSHFSVKTLNGLGFQAWRNSNPQVKTWTVEAKKLGKLVSEITRARRVSLDGDQWTALRELIQAAMLLGLRPDAPTESWRTAADSLLMSQDDFDFSIDLAREILTENNRLARTGLISFDDQVYCPVILGGGWIKYPNIMVDESQDLNPLNHQMLAFSLSRGARIVVVGDPKQAIYAFRGADSQSMESMRTLSTEWHDLPLRTTFRCPKVIVARQQEHAPGFTAWEGCRDGTFISLPTAENKGWTLADLPQTGRTAILCRNNAPLMALAFRLLRAGTGVRMLGRDFGRSLIALSRKIVKDDREPRDKCASLIEEWKIRETSLARANSKDELVEGIIDRAEGLQAVLSHAEARDAGELRAVLERLFAREEGVITLSSIHRSKGLEWENVIHLDPFRIPSKWALREGGSALTQEHNLQYVCETRSKNYLAEADLEDFAI